MRPDAEIWLPRSLPIAPIRCSIARRRPPPTTWSAWNGSNSRSSACSGATSSIANPRNRKLVVDLPEFARRLAEAVRIAQGSEDPRDWAGGHPADDDGLAPRRCRREAGPPSHGTTTRGSSVCWPIRSPFCRGSQFAEGHCKRPRCLKAHHWMASWKRTVERFRPPIGSCGLAADSCEPSVKKPFAPMLDAKGLDHARPPPNEGVPDVAPRRNVYRPEWRAFLLEVGMLACEHAVRPDDIPWPSYLLIALPGLN